MDPQIIVLGGGMAAAGKFLLDSVERHFLEQYWKIETPRAELRIAEMSNDAGFIGAALLAGERVDSSPSNRRMKKSMVPIVAPLHGRDEASQRIHPAGA